MVDNPRKEELVLAWDRAKNINRTADDAPW